MEYAFFEIWPSKFKFFRRTAVRYKSTPSLFVIYNLDNNVSSLTDGNNQYRLTKPCYKSTIPAAEDTAGILPSVFIRSATPDNRWLSLRYLIAGTARPALTHSTSWQSRISPSCISWPGSIRTFLNPHFS